MIVGQDFLKQAQAWIHSTAEADWRSAISRAYYGAFHVARKTLRDLGFTVPQGDRSHAYLWMRLSNCGDVNVRRAGSDLNRLRGERNRADYDIDRALFQIDALLQVQAAGRIISTLDAAVADPTRTKITDAMRVYERNVLRDVTWRP
jgi:uncharacterized protein (UPF0332 family)